MKSTDVNNDIKGKTVTLKPETAAASGATGGAAAGGAASAGSFLWKCVKGTTNPVPEKFLPSSCR